MKRGKREEVMRVGGWKGTGGRKAEMRREETHAVGEKLGQV